MTERAGILLVDHNERNIGLLSSFLHEAGYRTHQVSSIAAFDELLAMPAPGDEIALALVDLSGFDAFIWDRCRGLHEAGITFIVIARNQSAENQVALRRRSRGAGATHMLTKPLRKEQLLTLVRILTGTDDEPA